FSRDWSSDVCSSDLAGVRDPRRRVDASLEATVSGDGVRWRPRVEGQAPDWRLRFTADSEFSGWRAQWVYTGHPFWEVTAVYKERSEEGRVGKECGQR